MIKYIRIVRPENDTLHQFREDISAQFKRARGDAPVELDEHDKDE
ncbi:hypothetical protein [Mycolicibacter arupensis]|nr:hypothetical protein [Mycolicibacter arupensis]